MDNKPNVSRARQKRTREQTRDSTRHHNCLTTRLVLSYLFLLSALLFMLNLGRDIVITDLTPGQLAPSTLQARVDFTTTDLAATQLKRERVKASLPPVVVVREQPLSEIRRTLESFFDQLEKTSSEEADSGNAPGHSERDFQEDLRLLNLPKELASSPADFADMDLEPLRRALLRQTETTWRRGILSTRDRESGFQGNVPGQTVQLGPGGPERDLTGFPDSDLAAALTVEKTGEQLTIPPAVAAHLEVLLKDLLIPNLMVDPIATRAVRENRVESVPPVTLLREKGETLVEARSPVTEQVMLDLRAHEAKAREMEDGGLHLSRTIGQGIYLAIGLAVSLAFLFLFDPPAIRRTNRLLLWVLLTLASVALGQGLIYLSAHIHLLPGHLVRPLLPMSLAPMLATILYGPRLGLAVGISSSLAHALRHDMDLTIFFTGLALAVGSAISVKAIHRRSNVFRAGIWIGGIKVAIIAGAGILDLYTPQIIAHQSLAAFGSGLLAALLVLLLITPFETLFGVTTDIRLLELSDMSHPLLSRMALEAPGTYHHSLMVAHLAQAAAREIEANDLLVRVCAYYHDIGKLTKPEFFIENGQGRQNPHDDLSPSMSRLLIISHVKEGVSLAKRYKLPAVLIEGIEQHHGTSVIQYFYHRARTRAEESKESAVQAEDYRYPGPKPRTAEMGLLMMADSIEAASRSIDKNKPGQVEGLVNEIVQEKINDGQFDRCAITMEEINAARRSFIFSLKNMLHGRVEYPKDPKEPEDKSSPPPSASTPRDPSPGKDED